MDSPQIIIIISAVMILFLIYLYASATQRVKANQALISQLQKQVTMSDRHAGANQTTISQLQSKVGTLQQQMNTQALQLHEEWRKNDCEAIRVEQRNLALMEAKNYLQQWITEKEIAIRQDAIQRSQAVITGRVTEHLMPYMATFPYNPKDTRFIGSPVDLIVFDGLDEGNLRNIVFIEVKTGGATLSARQRQIRDAISNDKVQWRVLQMNS